MEKILAFPEEEEEEDEDWPSKIRHEVIEFVLQRFGLLSASDLAHALKWKVGEVNRTLKELESSGRVKRTKLGRTYVWTHIEEHHFNKMFY